jgi:hypothetical protein
VCCVVVFWREDERGLEETKFRGQLEEKIELPMHYC